MNFFSEQPEDRFCNPDIIQQTVANEYTIVTTPERKFGDLVVLCDQAGDTIHSAVYVADDIVFTKNGAADSQPFIYMHLDDVLALMRHSARTSRCKWWCFGRRR